MGRVYEGVPEAWADHNEQDAKRARKEGKRVRFDGPTLYSYYTAVAKYHNGPNGKYVLMTSENHSVSTSSHMRAAWSAIDVPVFYVPHIGELGGWSAERYFASDQDRHTANLQYLWEKVTNQANADIHRWRSMIDNTWRVESSRQQLASNWDTCVEYADVAGVMFTAPIPKQQLLKWVAVEVEARIEKWNEPKAVAKRERDRARRLAKNALL